MPFGTTSASIAIASPPSAASTSGEAVVERIEPGLEHRSSADGIANPSPPSQSSSSTGSPAQASGIFDRAVKLHRAGVHRPEVLQLDAAADLAAGRERPVGDGDLAGIAPGAQLFQAPDEAIQAAGIEHVYHAVPPGTIRAAMRSASLGRFTRAAPKLCLDLSQKSECLFVR